MNTRALFQVLNGSAWTDTGSDYADHLGQYTSEPLAPGTYRVVFTNMDYRTQVHVF